MNDAPLTDAVARTVIKTELHRTLFVEAGAGSGKTKSLVDRVVATVLADGGVPLRSVAAVTFTEKAAAELRDRLRAEFEEAERQAASRQDPIGAARAAEALDDLDSAAIGTLHSFAQRVLGEHPIEAGLPPLVQVQDEVASQVAFSERWTALAAELLEDQDLRDALLLGLSAGIKFEQLRSIARDFNAEWDRLEAAVLSEPPSAVPAVDVSEIVSAARGLAAEQHRCTDAADKFLTNLQRLDVWADRIEAAVDGPARLEVLRDAAYLKTSYGKKGNWPGSDLEEIRARLRELVADAATLRGRVVDRVLRRLAHRIAEATVAGARERQGEGRLEFHDLLVLSRELVRSPEHGAVVRGELSDRYRCLLLDEFQDTDPIQIELAVRIAGGAGADAAEWSDVAIPEGSLFVVGDPKQSIYRFRRADISTYLDAQSRIGSQERLTTNFRTTATVLDWVNHVFARLIVDEPGSQPPYLPLDHHRADPVGGSNVLVLGKDAHPAGLNADQVRSLEADEVAAAIRTALADKWPVLDQPTGRWRDVRLDDIAVLVPARTSLPHLEHALDAAGVPFRAEASSLVYRTAEVRELLMAARALDDPSDALALVTTLRSSMFGCGDDDLWTWKQAHGSFNLLAPAPEDLALDHPVREAVAYLRSLFGERTWLVPSELLDRLVRDRRMLEAATDGPRARDVWRRLRFVVDQARAWTEVEHGGLREYLGWARRQGDESARVAEAVLPETDTNAVRVLTIHAAKGLEFPVVIVSGLSSRPGGGGRGGVDVLWTRDGGYEFKLGKDLQTGDFEAAKPVDEQMDFHERLRLLYVACTRARDHLVVSTHRAARGSAPASRSALTNAELLAEASQAAPGVVELSVSLPTLADRDAVPGRAAVPYDQWLAKAEAIRAAAARPSAISASSMEGTPTGRIASPEDDAGPDPGLAKGARDLELPPWNKGRYGTAIGRAVHGALQTVDLSTGAGVEEAVAAQVLAEGVLEYQLVVLDMCRQALASDIVQRAAARSHWRETYVGTVLDDGTVLEGFIDLVYREDDGSLVVVDYKTASAPTGALSQRVDTYLPQMAAYAEALSRATGGPVTQAVLLFLSIGTSTAFSLDAADWSSALPIASPGF